MGGGPKMAHLGIWAQNGENHKHRDFSQISAFLSIFSIHSVRNLFLEGFGVVLKNFEFCDTKNEKTGKIHYRFVGEPLKWLTWEFRLKIAKIRKIAISHKFRHSSISLAYIPLEIYFWKVSGLF